MKRVLFASLLAGSMFAFACQPEPTNTNSNANANVSGPTAKEEPVVALTKEDKAVVIVITGDAASPIIVLVPDPITLHKLKNEKVRWCVYNNLDDPIDDVTITGFTPSDPFDVHLPFKTGPIAAGNSNCTLKGKAAVLGTFKYTITVIRSGHAPLVKDPQVVINN